jgi:hypothetical protein
MSISFQAEKTSTFKLPMDFYLYKETLVGKAAGTLAPPRARKRKAVNGSKEVDAC